MAEVNKNVLCLSQGRRKLFSIGGGGGLKARAEGPRKFLNLESLKCHSLDFGEDLTEF
jgi:hypothetical protein